MYILYNYINVQVIVLEIASFPDEHLQAHSRHQKFKTTLRNYIEIYKESRVSLALYMYMKNSFMISHPFL